MSRALALFCACCLLSSTSHAGTVDVTTQFRYLHTEAHANDGDGQFEHPFETVNYPDPGFWTNAIGSSGYVSNGYSIATSNQESDHSPYAISGEASVYSYSVSSFGTQGAYAYGSCESRMHFYFTLDQGTGFTFSGLIQGSADHAGNHVTFKEQLNGPTLYYYELTSSELHIPFHETGFLPAGDYIITATTTAATAYVNEISEHGASFDFLFLLDSAVDAPVVAAMRPIAAAPNPFRSSTRLTLPEGVPSAVILDARGRRVTQVGADGLWDGTDGFGRTVPAGVYFVRAEGLPSEALKVVRLR